MRVGVSSLSAPDPVCKGVYDLLCDMDSGSGFKPLIIAVRIILQEYILACLLELSTDAHRGDGLARSRLDVPSSPPRVELALRVGHSARVTGIDRRTMRAQCECLGHQRRNSTGPFTNRADSPPWHDPCCRTDRTSTKIAREDNPQSSGSCFRTGRISSRRSRADSPLWRDPCCRTDRTS